MMFRKLTLAIIILGITTNLGFASENTLDQCQPSYTDNTQPLAVMNKETAKKFVERLLHAWENGLLDEFESLYHSNAVGSLDQKIQLSYTDIKNRFEYVTTNNTNRKFTVQDMMVEDNKVMLFFRYEAFDTHLKEPVNAPTMWLFTLDRGKIAKIEILTSLQFNYQASS